LASRCAQRHGVRDSRWLALRLGVRCSHDGGNGDAGDTVLARAQADAPCVVFTTDVLYTMCGCRSDIKPTIGEMLAACSAVLLSFPFQPELLF
jgi:hypothetical protein